MKRNKVLGQKRGYAQSIKKNNRKRQMFNIRKNKSILMFCCGFFFVMIFVFFVFSANASCLPQGLWNLT